MRVMKFNDGILTFIVAFLSIHFSACHGKSNDAHNLFRRHATYTPFPTSVAPNTQRYTFLPSISDFGSVSTSEGIRYTTFPINTEPTKRPYFAIRPFTSFKESSTNVYVEFSGKRSKPRSSFPSFSANITEQACKGYSFNRYDFEGSSPKLNCAKTNPVIIDGMPVKEKEFPHMALIGYEVADNVEWRCTGTLISERYVLSVAHCGTIKQYGDAKWVRLGELNLNKKNEISQQDWKIIKMITYNGYSASTYYHDIILFKIQCCPLLNAFVRPICLDTSPNQYIGTNVIISGWGHTAPHSENSSGQLVKALTNITPLRQCDDMYSGNEAYPYGISASQLLCVKNAKCESTDACNGDLGSPLMIPKSNETCLWSQVGIKSYDPSYNISWPNKKVRSVYVRISFYIKWIQEIVWPQ